LDFGISSLCSINNTLTAAVADQKPLHLMNSYLHGQIRSSFAGDSHTATSALHLLDIAYGAEPESCVDDMKIMPPQPTKETTNSR